MTENEQIYKEVIQTSQKNVNNLATKLAELKQWHEDIKELTTKSEQLPIEFDKKFGEIRLLSEKYTTDLGVATKVYLEGNNTLFTSHLKDFSLKINALQIEINRLLNTDFTQLFAELQKGFIEKTREDLAIELKKFDAKSQDLQLKINALQTEISRLLNTDFVKLFAELQKEFIKKTREDLAIELKKFDAKSQDLQLKINALQTEITRLENIDLEKHFNKLQKTLSDIFGAVNALNLSFTTIIQTLNTLVESVGNISTKMQTNHADIQGSIKEFRDNIFAHLKEQDIEINRNNTSLEKQQKTLIEQNERLKKNQLIIIVGFILTLMLSLYNLFKH